MTEAVKKTGERTDGANSSGSDILVFDGGELRWESPESYAQHANVGHFDLVNIKVGSGVAFPDGRLVEHNVYRLGKELAEVAEQRSVLVTASGSEAMGRYLRGAVANGETPRQRLQYVLDGEKEIFDMYADALARHGIMVVRHYVTQEEALNDLPETRKLLEKHRNSRGVVILTNEDDKDTIQQIDIDGVGYRVFADNDGLWALETEKAVEDGFTPVAINVCAVDGIYEKTSWEKGDPVAIEVISNSDGLEEQVSSKRRRSIMGKGGVASKIAALQRQKPLAYAGVINGLYMEHREDYMPVSAFINGERLGSRSPPRGYAAASRNGSSPLKA